VKKVILLNKKEGETPLEALEKFRAKHKKYQEIRMTYAGRLDPMAKGLLIVLVGEEVKNKEKYLKLDKEYAFDVLFGFATDAYDILGKIASSSELHVNNRDLEEQIKNNIKSFLGENIQKYPMYSSKTVKGRPLFAYARSGEEVEIPERKVFIKKLRLERIRTINNKKLFENIKRRIKKVKGDFRQEDILKIWQKNLNVKHRVLNKFFIAGFKVKCSSGTYVRGIANEIGKRVKIPALAFSIKRTRIGKYVL
jgi:tRNA pseudouridine55 synthase